MCAPYFNSRGIYFQRSIPVRARAKCLGREVIDKSEEEMAGFGKFIFYRSSQFPHLMDSAQRSDFRRWLLFRRARVRSVWFLRQKVQSDSGNRNWQENDPVIQAAGSRDEQT